MQTTARRGLRLAFILFLLWLAWLVVRRSYLLDASLPVWLFGVVASTALACSFGWVLRGWRERRAAVGR